ncbi:hypothetical protein SAMN04515647_2315 [Cohaesibacter sp. ES.047]|uniref:hypothetical protein n=1 Tax=Cohaesibacter sp. ES.047 TaxID=1798205 RepID=UPI000BB9538C|nr:hypothetical protein [Cohaesibacter sp. ES.047]SNY92067.1 hypothetical protein SAMN04515647_2315 [Cohaesibacter sp. ES.047]
MLERLESPQQTANTNVPYGRDLTRRNEFAQPGIGISSSIRIAKLEEDLAWHHGQHALESWQFSTNLHGMGKTFSFRVDVILVKTGKGKSEASLGLCLMDLETGWIRETDTMLPLEDLHVGGKGLRIQTPELTIRGSSTDISIIADMPDAFVELSGLVLNPVLLNNGGAPFHFLGAKQRKFAVPAMSVSGAVTLMGMRQSVNGAMWFNRQWGELPKRFSLGRDLERRQWINVYPHLDNGISLSVTQFWDFETDTIDTECTVMLSDGTNVVEAIEPLQMHNYVNSRRSGKRYPRHLVLSSEPLETCLQISLPDKHREVLSKMGQMTKFDGKINVSGYLYGEAVSGDGFAEMLGRWR